MSSYLELFKRHVRNKMNIIRRCDDDNIRNDLVNYRWGGMKEVGFIPG